MRKSDQEKLVDLIDRGQNTYADIRQAFPDTIDIDGELDALSPPKPNSDFLIICPNRERSGNWREYQYKDFDTFELTEDGLDLLDAFREREHLRSQQETAIAYAKLAYRATIAIGLAGIALQLIALLAG